MYQATAAGEFVYDARIGNRAFGLVPLPKRHTHTHHAKQCQHDVFAFAVARIRNMYIGIRNMYIGITPWSAAVDLEGAEQLILDGIRCMSQVG